MNEEKATELAEDAVKFVNTITEYINNQVS